MAPKLCDTSFFSHALVPSQASAEARSALIEALRDEAPPLATEVIAVEWLSVLRKLIARQVLTAPEADEARQTFSASVSSFLPVTEHDAHSGFVLAADLGQTDTFDATGYVVARRHGVEFWVSDRRFANAAAAAGLIGARFYP